VTFFALLPLIIGGNRPGQEIEQPMAVVIVAGLVSSTLLNLFVLPSMYLRFARPQADPEDEELGDAAAVSVRGA
jgi:Cu/Ag efflux pump CusA